MRGGGQIRLAIVGVGNCASSLVQGLAHYRGPEAAGRGGLSHPVIGGYRPEDIVVSAAWDVDRRKVGRDVANAIFARPNCTKVFRSDVPPTGVKVAMGCILDGIAPHMTDEPEDRHFAVAGEHEPARGDVIAALRDSGADVMINYLPVGSQRASEFYAGCALDAGVAFVNAIPVFIASDPHWSQAFREARVPLIGDDIKAQVGATIVHRVLTDLFHKRGVTLKRTYQLNTGGNTDFLNMLDRSRLIDKKVSKTEAVQAVAGQRLDSADIHVGPSDYVAWQDDNKVCFLRMEGELFGGVPMDLELRLSVEDSPNSAGVAIDMIRCAQAARDQGLLDALPDLSAAFCKHPIHQTSDDIALARLEQFIEQTRPVATAEAAE